MITIKNLYIKSYSLDYLDVYWEMEPVYDDILNYEFIVQKSNNQFGPFHSISTGIINNSHFRDLSVRGSVSKNSIYYRLIIKNRVSGVENIYPEEGNGIRLEAKLDLTALEIARINFLKLKELAGRRIWILPVKVFGQHCKCYDPVMRRKVRSNCVTCYDTGWVGGYDSPVETYGLIIQPDDILTKTNFGDVQIKNGYVNLPNYPIVEDGFIIVDPDNNRWKIMSPVKRVKKYGAVVRQEAPVQLITKDDICYSINLNISHELETEPESNYKNLTTID